MKLFKKKIIIYRETSFLSDRPNKYFFFWIFGLKLADIESLFWLKFCKSKSIWFISCCHSNCILRRKKLFWWWFDDYEVQLFIWEMSPTLHSVAGLPFRPLGAEPTAYPPRPDAAERNEAARNLKSHHSVLNFVTWLPVLCSLVHLSINEEICKIREYSSLIDIFRSERKFLKQWDGKGSRIV